MTSVDVDNVASGRKRRHVDGGFVALGRNLLNEQALGAEHSGVDALSIGQQHTEGVVTGRSHHQLDVGSSIIRGLSHLILSPV